MEKIDTFFAIFPSVITLAIALYFAALAFQAKRRATRESALYTLADLRMGYGSQLLLLGVSGLSYTACAAMGLPIFGLAIVFMAIVYIVGANVAIHTVDKYA